MDQAAIVAAAERIVGVHLDIGEGIERGYVRRLLVDGGPESVIVKYRGDADDQYWGELAALDFLCGLPDGPPGTPALIGADEDAHIIVMEDLGPGPSLVAALLADKRDEAVTALRAWIDALARVHVATAPYLEDYRRHRGAVIRSEGSPRDPADRVAYLGEVTGVPMPSALVTALDEAAAALDGAGPFAALTLGDCCPDNNRLMADGSVRLFDFEWASWMHALHDAAFVPATMPTCWCVRRLPDDLRASLVARYRKTLVASRPKCEEAFDRDIALATLWHLTVRLRRALEWDAGEGWGGRRIESAGFRTITDRQDALFRLELLMELGGEVRALESAADWATEAESALVARWGEVPDVPLYPALGGPPPAENGT